MANTPQDWKDAYPTKGRYSAEGYKTEQKYHEAMLRQDDSEATERTKLAYRAIRRGEQ